MGSQVRDALKGRHVQVLTVRVEVGQQFRLKATRLLPTERPCIVLRDRDSIALLPNIVQRILSLRGEIVPTMISNRKKSIDTVEHSDLVFYTAPCRQFVEEVVPAGKKKQEVFFEFTPDALELVRQAVWM